MTTANSFPLSFDGRSPTSFSSPLMGHLPDNYPCLAKYRAKLPPGERKQSMPFCTKHGQQKPEKADNRTSKREADNKMSYCDYILRSWKLVSKYCMIGSGDELLNREIFTTLAEARILIEAWRKEYNQERPHSALNYRPPAPEAIVLVGLT